jgi:hypothetical protein
MNVTVVVKSPISGCEPSFSGVISSLLFVQPEGLVDELR